MRDPLVCNSLSFRPLGNLGSQIQQAMDVTLIGHGSLMSGRGLARSGRLRVHSAGIVALRGCRRGFAKLSRYGDRLATDLELAHFPLEADAVSPADRTDGRVEALGLRVCADDGLRLVQREGYRPAALQAVMERAKAAGLGVAEWLWRLAAECGHDVATYRERLCTLTGYTSPHYIPHPIRLNADDSGLHDYALLFLAPGRYGTGSPDVTSVRERTGIDGLFTAAEAWRRKPNDGQLAYVVSCLLAGVHGIDVCDLLAGIEPQTDLARLLAERIRTEADGEAACFLETTGLSETAYTRAFGGGRTALRRSGLEGFLDVCRTG